MIYKPTLILILSLLTLASVPSQAVEIDGFTEPYRTVEVAAPEMGIVTAVMFRVGDVVKKGEVTATLDDDIHRLLVDSAKARKEARGRLESARAEVNLRKTRLAKIETVIAKGHGRQEEVDRANADLEIAAANVLVAEDEILLRTLDHRKLLAELERRNVRSPIDGVVVENLKEVGEFVAPNDPRILKVVQLNPLLAKFALRTSRAKHVRIGQTMKVSFASIDDSVEATVEEISPLIDAESGTIRVKLRVDNPDGRLRSGQRCMLEMADLYEEAGDNVALRRPSTMDRAMSKRKKSETKTLADTRREEPRHGG